MYQDQDPAAPTRPLDSVAERLLRARSIVISGEITQKLAADVVSQLVALAAESDGDITVFVNSQGGTSRPAIPSTTSYATSGPECA